MRGDASATKTPPWPTDGVRQSQQPAAALSATNSWSGQRPSYSLLLDCSETRRVLELPAAHWRQALRQLLEAVA